MCGIVGCFGDLPFTADKMFRDLLIIDQLRGMDSTGIYVVPDSQVIEPRLFKTVGGVESLDQDLHDEREKYGILYNSTMSDRMRLGVPRPLLMLGHNRKATAGSITAENAHPFEFSNIVGVHNGTMDWPSLMSFKDYRSESDTYCLYSEINERGIEPVYAEASGAMALVWWDKARQQLNFLRNMERPLWATLITVRNTNALSRSSLWWASERDMLELVFERHLPDSAWDRDKITQFTVDHLYQFGYKPGEPGITGGRIVSENLSGKKLTPAPIFTQKGGNWGRHYDFGTEDFSWGGSGVSVSHMSKETDHRSKSKGTEEEAKPPMRLSDGTLFISPPRRHGKGLGVDNTGKKPDQSVASVTEVTKGYNHNILRRPEWQQIVNKTNCVWCDTTAPSWDEREEVVFINDTSWICRDCDSDGTVKQYIKSGVY